MTAIKVEGSDKRATTDTITTTGIAIKTDVDMLAILRSLGCSATSLIEEAGTAPFEMTKTWMLCSEEADSSIVTKSHL